MHMWHKIIMSKCQSFDNGNIETRQANRQFYRFNSLTTTEMADKNIYTKLYNIVMYVDRA